MLEGMLVKAVKAVKQVCEGYLCSHAPQKHHHLGCRCDYHTTTTTTTIIIITSVIICCSSSSSITTTIIIIHSSSSSNITTTISINSSKVALTRGHQAR